MRSQAGIKALGIMAIGSIASPTYFTPMGLRGKSVVTFEEFNQPETHRAQKLRNMVNIKIDTGTLQGSGGKSDLYTLFSLVNFVKQGGVDAQVVLMEGAKASNIFTGDVLNFSGDDHLGIGFEFNLSPKGREHKVMLEAAVHYTRAESIILAAKTNAQLAGFNAGSALLNQGIRYDYYAAPFLSSLQAPSGTDLFDKTDWKNWNLSIKTVGEKSELNNRDHVNYCEVVFEFIGSNAGIMNDKIQTMLAKANEVGLVLGMGLDSGTTQTLSFAPGQLALNQVLTFGDDERSIKMTWSGQVPVNDLLAGLATYATGSVVI